MRGIEPNAKTGLLALAAISACACGAPSTVPRDEPELVVEDASAVGAAEDAGAAPEPMADADGGAEAQPVEPPEIHPLLQAYRTMIGGWLTARERRAFDRVELTGTGMADGAKLARAVHDRAASGMVSLIFDRVGSKQLRDDARGLRQASGARSDSYGDESAGYILVNYTISEFESTECWESDYETGRRRTLEYSRRCSLAFAAARLLHDPLDERLRWPGFGPFGNCRGEPGYDPEDQMPCFTSGSEGGSLVVLFDLALEIGVPRRKVVAFATKTLKALAREAAEQDRVARIEFEAFGSSRLAAMVHALERWMTGDEWRRFERSTGIASASAPDRRSVDRLLHRFGKRVISPLWRKTGTKKARQLGRALELELVDHEEKLAFAAILEEIEDNELLGTGEMLQCPEEPEARFERCRMLTEATWSFLDLAGWWGEERQGGPPELDEELCETTEIMLDELVVAGAPRQKLVRELTAAFRQVSKSR